MKTLSYSMLIFIAIIAISFSCKKEKKDTKAPVITLNPPVNPYFISKDSAYIEPGYKATDDQDGDITSKVVVTNGVNVHDTGYYQVKYNVSDKAGNAAIEKIRTVHVVIF